MGEEHSSALTFSLEESVWLDQGEKISELLSLGLEPDIRIEEKYDYVEIKGGLHLNGEYYPFREEETREESQAGQPVPQYVEKNTRRDDGVGELQHFFPVDVTIPLNRINNLDDIYVNIDGFDYDLPEPGCIQLTADVSITGMKEEEVEQEQQRVEAVSVPEAMPSWQMEATHLPEDEGEDAPVEPLKREVETTNEPQEEEREAEVETEEDPAESAETPAEDDEVEQTEEIITAFHSRDPEPAFEEEQEEGTEEEATPDQSDQPEKTVTSDRDDNALYLTKMMTNGEEEFSRLKMCIIQENESLDTIADRYQTTISHLLRFNRLDNEHLEEGEILYIPATVSRSNENE